MKTLFICHGNVGRSQIAEGYYNHFTKSFDAISAGVDPTTPSRWKAPAPEVLEVMKEEQIDLSEKKVKYVTEEMVNQSDKIFILCKKEYCPDFLLKHPTIFFWEIEDPYKTSIETFRIIRNEIKKKVLESLKVD